MKVLDLMNPKVISVGPKTPLREILQLMLRYHLNNILVVDSEQRLAGIVTYSDISRKLLPTEEDEKALAEYLAVDAAQPDLPGVHFWLGHLYWKHGDADHALTELTRELELSPGHPEANGELGAVLVAQDRSEEAIPHLEAAIQSKTDLWPAYEQLGRAYASEKKYTRAEQVLSRALAHDQDGTAHYQFALVLRAEGKTAQAAQAFEQVRAIKNERMVAPSTDDAENERAKQ